MQFFRRRKTDGEAPLPPRNSFFGTVGSPIKMANLEQRGGVDKRDRPAFRAKDDNHWIRQGARPQQQQPAKEPAPGRPRHRRRHSLEGLPGPRAPAPAPTPIARPQQAQPKKAQSPPAVMRLPAKAPTPTPVAWPSEADSLDAQASVNPDAATLDVKKKLVLHKEIQRHQRQQAAAAAAIPRKPSKHDILSVHDSSEDSEDDGRDDVATLKLRAGRHARRASDLLESPPRVEPAEQLKLDGARKAKIPHFMSAWFTADAGEEKPAKEVKKEAVAAPALPQKATRALDDEKAGVVKAAGRSSASNASRGSSHSQHIVFNEITLGRMIGEGAFGKVYEGKWRGKGVAVKVLVCQELRSDILNEFQSEIEIMSVLRHPNICRLLGACMEPPNRALVVELMQRGSLWGVLRTHRKTLDMEMRTRFIYDTAKGMAYLHHFERPILHRDLKSPNLLADKNYNVKLADFGLARVKAHVQTMTGNCGTVQWMAPEVLGNQKYTEKADVFSFGIVIWEIMTGECPYDGMSQIQAALGVLNRNLRPTMPRDCPPFFAKLMKACWNRQPELRPTFTHIVSAFRTYQSDLSKTRATSEAAASANAAVAASIAAP